MNNDHKTLAMIAYINDGPAMVSLRQRSADFFVRYAIVDTDRQ